MSNEPLRIGSFEFRFENEVSRVLLEDLIIQVSQNEFLSGFFENPVGPFTTFQQFEGGPLLPNRNLEGFIEVGVSTRSEVASRVASFFGNPTVLLNINPNFENNYYINSAGQRVNYPVERLITHELVHLVTGELDVSENPTDIRSQLVNPNDDVVGETVRITNIIVNNIFTEINELDRLHYITFLNEGAIEGIRSSGLDAASIDEIVKLLTMDDYTNGVNLDDDGSVYAISA